MILCQEPTHAGRPYPWQDHEGENLTGKVDQVFRDFEKLPPALTLKMMYIIYGETDHQPRLDAWDKGLDLVHWENLEGAGGEGGGRWGSG